MLSVAYYMPLNYYLFLFHFLWRFHVLVVKVHSTYLILGDLYRLSLLERRWLVKLRMFMKFLQCPGVGHVLGSADVFEQERNRGSCRVPATCWDPSTGHMRSQIPWHSITLKICSETFLKRGFNIKPFGPWVIFTWCCIPGFHLKSVAPLLFFWRWKYLCHMFFCALLVSIVLMPSVFKVEHLSRISGTLCLHREQQLVYLLFDSINIEICWKETLINVVHERSRKTMKQLKCQQDLRFQASPRLETFKGKVHIQDKEIRWDTTQDVYESKEKKNL